MKKFGLLLFLGFLFSVSGVEAQAKRSGKRKLKAKNVKVAKKLPKIVSRGVVNNRAIDLVKPEYPPIAKDFRAFGSVNVQILIDENGNVVSAKAISGHLFLHNASVKAALQSKFEPLNLGGDAVRVNGIIVYNYNLCRT